jgi:hypothetical protein
MRGSMYLADIAEAETSMEYRSVMLDPLGMSQRRNNCRNSCHRENPVAEIVAQADFASLQSPGTSL